MSISNSLVIKNWPVDRLIPYARNARTHSQEQVAQIAGSIRAFGFNNPVLVDLEGGIIAGHGRVLAARQLGLTEVPVIELEHLNANEKRAFILADNKIALNAGWDEEMLRLELDALAAAALDIELTGFRPHELDELAASAIAALNQDEAPARLEQAVTKTGDIWRMGQHRVLCGDGTSSEDLERILDGLGCDMVFADFPYNVNYEGKTADKLKLSNDNLGDDFGPFLDAACNAVLKVCRGGVYICMSSSELHRLYPAFIEAGGHWSTYIIWAKNNFTLGHADYQRAYEVILYGWREGQKHHWCGARNQGDVWLIAKPRVNDLHPTMKPVELVERAIQNSSRRGAVVLDTFAGSGTTAIACERLGRKARLVELDPNYVDVIVRRWQDFTGQNAYLEANGLTFEQVSRSAFEAGGHHE